MRVLQAVDIADNPRATAAVDHFYTCSYVNRTRFVPHYFVLLLPDDDTVAFGNQHFEIREFFFLQLEIKTVEKHA